MFWDVAHPEQALVVLLDHEKYTRLLIEVADPSATIAAIESAIKQREGARSGAAAYPLLRRPGPLGGFPPIPVLQ